MSPQARPTDATGLQSLVLKLESWVQEEIGAQRRMVDLLAKQEAEIMACRPEEVSACGKAIEGELSTVPGRERRRREVVEALARAWGLGSGVLTVSSVCVRLDEAGIDATRLRRMRDDLRDATAKALRLGRRISVLARYHGELFQEVVGVLVGNPAGSQGEQHRGALLDTQV